MATAQEFDALYKYVSALPVFSDHEHHRPDSFFAEKVTLFKLLENSCVAWTGLDCGETAESRRKWLEAVRFNSYFRWFEKGLQQVHGLEGEITAENWDAISEKISARYAEDADFHWRALPDHGYERLILDTYWQPGHDDGHPEIFIPTYRIDKFMYGYHGESIAPDDFPVWQRYGFSGGTLDDFVEMMQATIRARHKQGKVAALKCAEAYNRSIDFLPDDRSAAQKAFGQHPSRISEQLKLAFSNYIFNRACEVAEELNVPFQIHTGLGQLAGTEPMKLRLIIVKYPKVRFVLFHAGFPWMHEAAGLVHEYPNALPNLTWMPTLCTSAAIRVLDDYIDLAYSCGFITWGSDCWAPEESVGAMLAWRLVVTKVLAERLADGQLTASDAEMLARKLMYENNRNVYCPNWKP